jgi:hypothetical protein
MSRKIFTPSPILLLLAVSASAIAQSPPASQSAASTTASTSTGVEELSLDPRYGQTAKQQATDRYACHEWSKSQSGYDPTLSGGGVPPSEMPSRRDQYRHAMTACLEARGYGVRYAAAAPAPGVKTAKATSASPPRGCVADTATRIPLRPSECAAFGNSWTQQDIKSTGATDVGQALRLLDPTLTVHE